MIAVAVVACLLEAGRTVKYWHDRANRARQVAVLLKAYQQMQAQQLRSIVGFIDRLDAENLAQQREWERAAGRLRVRVPSDTSPPK
jgi:hypothetical protein